MVTLEQNLFGAEDSRAIEVFQEKNGLVQELGDLEDTVCHTVSVRI
jgi:hypothetical protein